VVQVHSGPPARAGGVAQLVEHLVCNQAVVGSSPVASTPPSEGKRPLVGKRQTPGLRMRGLFENKVNRIKRGITIEKTKWLSSEECMVDALVSRADEGRSIAAISFGEPLSRL
jgi:hypothetical protein